jgi:hypothetical protein
MKHLVSIALALMVAVTFGSASWAGDKGKANAYAFGKVGDNNPLFKWTPEADSVANNSNRAAEASVDKKSNGVLEQPTNPNNVCNNPVSAEPGRNPHCPLNP